MKTIMVFVAAIVLILVAGTMADLTPSEIHAVENQENRMVLDNVIFTPSINAKGEAATVSDKTYPHEKSTSSSLKRDSQVVCTIAEGCTNSGTALNNGKLMYTSSGAIIEAPYLKSSSGDTLTISGSGATSVVAVTPAKLNIIGTDSSQSAGPHIQFYTSADNYTNLQILSFSHNNIPICFDCYWDGSVWKSSYSGSNFQIYKQFNQLQFNYGSGSSAGSGVGLSNAFYIDTTGKTTFSQPIKLPSSGATASDLNFYTEVSGSCTVTASAGTYTVSSTTVKATRIGNVVHYTFPAMTGTLSNNAYIIIDSNCLNSAVLPTATTYWVTIVSESGSYGYSNIVWDSATSKFRIYGTSSTLFTSGTSRGIDHDIGFSVIKY